jgi:hypothetical protein
VKNCKVSTLNVHVKKRELQTFKAKLAHHERNQHAFKAKLARLKRQLQALKPKIIGMS